jgi:regulator of ribosome biosynthesis
MLGGWLLDADHDPSKKERKARKERVAKNERQRLQNVARSQQGRQRRWRRVPRATANGRLTALSQRRVRARREEAARGEAQGILPPFSPPPYYACSPLRPQFDPIEKPVDAERSSNLDLIKQIGNGAPGGSSLKKAKRDGGGGVGDVVNVRKAVRFASGGQGAAALARKSGAGSSSHGRQKRKGKQ